MSGRPVQIGNRICWAEGKYLVCQDADTGKRIFRKTFCHPQYETLRDLDIREVHVSPDGTDVVLLFDLALPGYKRVGNLARVTLEGRVVWWAELPDTGRDNYVAVEIGEERIVATSWGSYRCEINPETGRILTRTFTK